MTMLRDGCIHCYRGGRAAPHPGPHLVAPVHGGRASCPLDERDDLDLLEELAWVSLEAAIEDAGWPLLDCTGLAEAAGAWIPLVLTERHVSMWWRDHEIEWAERTDEHLEEITGTLDMVCTITAPLTLIDA